MAEETDNLQDKSQGEQKTKPLSRQAAYSKASTRFTKALDVIDDSLNSKNPSVRFGAAKLIYETVLPQKALIELTGEEGAPIKFESLDDEKIAALIHDKLKKLGIA